MKVVNVQQATFLCAVKMQNSDHAVLRAALNILPLLEYNSFEINKLKLT
jgi:hypothetical protein